MPSLPAGEIERVVVSQVRKVLCHPTVIARTYHALRAKREESPSTAAAARLEHLHERRQAPQSAIRSLLELGDHDGRFVKSELKRLSNELKSLESTIQHVESDLDQPSTETSLSDGTTALQRLDPIWDVLVSDEQRRILELLIERVTVSRERVTIRFRKNGIERVAVELGHEGGTECNAAS